MRKTTRYIFLSLILATVTAGITHGQNDRSTFWDSVNVDGLSRRYIVHLPSGYGINKEIRLPLVLFFHGGGGHAQGIIRYTGFDEQADAENFIVVYPDGYNKSWADGRGSTQASADHINDVKFTDLMLKRLVEVYRIDTTRIYAAGISNGGFMTQTLACLLPGRFAAIASVVASLPKNLENACSKSPPTGVLLICGTADPLVPYDGGRVNSKAGGEILGMEATLKIWAAQNGCNKTPVYEKLPNRFPDRTNVEKFTYSTCNSNKKVVMLRVNGGGHQYPGSSFKLPFVGPLCRDINATDEIWNFFKDQRLEK